MEKSLYKKTLVLAIVCCFIGTGVFPSIRGNTLRSLKMIYVDDSNTGGPWDGTQDHPYQYIQDGIDAAGNGDTVYVYSGTYYENVLINKQITLQGQSKNNTIIDGGEHGHIIQIKNEYVSVFNFNIRNGGQTGSGESGIKVYSEKNYAEKIDNVKIKNCIIENTDIGIYFSNVSHSSITQCNIFNNTGYSIFIALSSNNITISDNEIYNNGRELGSGWINAGCIRINPNWNPDLFGHICRDININDCNIHDNIGCGIEFINSKNVYIYNNNIFQNTWHGIIIDYNYWQVMQNTKINNNMIYNNGFGGIFVNNKSKTNICIRDNQIMNNGNGGSWAAGIFLSDCLESVIIENNYILQNDKNGICLLRSSGNEIVGNNLLDNIVFGIDCIDSSRNSIFLNSFKENAKHAYDDYNNSWDNGKKGNFWDDYEKKVEDANKKLLQGVWDKPYPIDGENNLDNYPLIKPYRKSKSRSGLPILDNILNRFFDNHPRFLLILRQLLGLQY